MYCLRKYICFQVSLILCESDRFATLLEFMFSRQKFKVSEFLSQNADAKQTTRNTTY